MLRFLYTDKMENANIHAKELLRAANKYNIPRMKLLAEEALCQNLSDDTVLLVAKFANVHNGGYAKDFAINCIVSNFGTLIRRPECVDFIKENPDLLHEIFGFQVRWIMGNDMVAVAPRFHGILLLEIIFCQIERGKKTSQEKQKCVINVLNYVCCFKF